MKRPPIQARAPHQQYRAQPPTRPHNVSKKRWKREERMKVVVMQSDDFPPLVDGRNRRGKPGTVKRAGGARAMAR